MLIDKLQIEKDLPHLVIPEIGACHDGNIETAIKMIDEVHHAGAKCVKFQLYSSSELVSDLNRITVWGPPDGKKVKEKIGNMFDRFSLNKKQLNELFVYSRSKGLVPFATPFSEKGVDQLIDLNVACFKIAASDVNHHRLLKYIASTGKPMILSLGKCTLAEADNAISLILESGCNELAILHCVASYPSPMNEMNLNVIKNLIQTYPECIVGFSDHSQGITASIAAVALGARIIEKHVTLNKKNRGPDHWFSIEMDELALLIQAASDAHSALGHPRKKILHCEIQGRQKSIRSLIANKFIPANTIVKEHHIKIVRPGSGILPQMIDAILGLKVTRDINENEPISWDMFK